VDRKFREQPSVVRYGRLAALIIAYFNDIFSWEREAQEETQLNSIELRCSLGQLTLAEAYAQQVQAIKSLLAEMIAIEGQLELARATGPSGPDDDSESSSRRRARTQYIEAIRNIVVGNHLWSLTDGRYQSEDSPFLELRHSRGERRRLASGVGGQRI